MTTLRNEILEHGRGLTPLDERDFVTPELFQEWLRRIAKAPAIDVTNVYSYVRELKKGGKASWSYEKDLPLSRPPFTEFWMEYATSEMRVGIFFYDLGEEAARILGSTATAKAKGLTQVYAGIVFGRTFDSVAPSYVPITVRVALDEKRTLSVDVIEGKVPTQADRRWAGMVTPCILAWSFMNCRNVQRVEHLPSRLEQKRARREGRPEPRGFYTLAIEALRKIVASQGAGKTGLHRALHICRGHFATYVPERAPRGWKLDGPTQIWRDQSTRGNPERGVVSKDYSVEAPNLTDKK